MSCSPGVSSLTAYSEDHELSIKPKCHGTYSCVRIPIFEPEDFVDQGGLAGPGLDTKSKLETPRLACIVCEDYLSDDKNSSAVSVSLS